MAKNRLFSKVYKSRLTHVRKLWRPVKMAELRKAPEPVLVERGADDSTLVIAFTSHAENFIMPVWEFMETTQILGYSRILLRDQYKNYYQSGIDDDRPDFPSLMNYLREEICRLKPAVVICVGASSGGDAAIRSGHHLGADFVHAFAPQDGLCGEPMRPSPSRKPRPPDFVPRLTESNGKTTYYIHYGFGVELDRYYANRAAPLPGVVTLGYPYDQHTITRFLAKRKLITELLLRPNQDIIIELAKQSFDDLKITGTLKP